MTRYTVTVSLLNVRSRIPQSLPDNAGIISTVAKGYTFTGTEVPGQQIPNPGMGKWYQDTSGNYYWGGGIMETGMPMSSAPLASDNNGSVNAANNQWWYQQLKIADLKAGLAGWNTPVNVAVLDTGLIQGSDVASAFHIAGKHNFLFGADVGNIADLANGHGTLCASLIAGKTTVFSGINPDAHLFIGKTVSDGATSNSTIITSAINTLSSDASAFKTQVISISGGVGYADDPDAFEGAVNDAVQQGIIVVAAIGNLSETDTGEYPALYKNCLSIGAYNEQLEPASDLNPPVKKIDFLFPGKNIKGINQLACVNAFNGTSHACAIAAGVISLILARAASKSKVWGLAEIKQFLQQSSDPFTNGAEGSLQTCYKINGNKLLTNFNLI